MQRSIESDQLEGQGGETYQTKETQPLEKELERKNRKGKILKQAQWEKGVKMLKWGRTDYLEGQRWD